MYNYIDDLYKALESFDCSQVVDIYYAVRNGDIAVAAEDIVPMCRMFAYEFQDTAPVNEQLIVKITFFIIDKCNMEIGLRELVKGLKELYDKSLADYGDSKRRGNTYEGLIDYIKHYINTFIASYNDSCMVLLGKLINEIECLEFKERIIQIIEKDLDGYEDEYLRKYKRITEDIVRKGKLLINNIQK